MNHTSGLTSGRSKRPLVLLVVTLLAAVSTNSAATAPAAVPVEPTQNLALLLSAHVARVAPSGRSAPIGLIPAKTPVTEQPTVLPVLGGNGTWLRVRLPGRPNGHTGWIRQRETLRAVTRWHLVVDPTRRVVIVYRAGRPVRTLSAIVGKSSTPTPFGRHFVEESIALRRTDGGAPFALALSARSRELQEFAGGPGQIAIHGRTNIGGVLGTAVSHGCIRLSTEAISWLAARIGPGVPVTITR